MDSSLVLVTGPPGTHPHDVAHAVAARTERAVHVDVGALGRVVVSGPGPVTAPADGVPSPAQAEELFLRWLAAVAVAETYQRSGYDALLSDHVTGMLLEDLLDILDPTPVHLVVLTDADPVSTPTGSTPTGPDRGLVLDGRSPAAELADAVLARLDEALVP